MKYFLSHTSWEGGMKHDNFMTLPEPIICNQCDIGIETFRLAAIPDEPIFIGYMVVISPYDSSVVTIKNELSHTDVYQAEYYLKTLSENCVRQAIYNDQEEKYGKGWELRYRVRDIQVPHVVTTAVGTCLFVPPRQYCELYFNHMIHITHLPSASDSGKYYDLTAPYPWTRVVHDPVFSIELQLNNDKGEKRVIKYTKETMYKEVQQHNISYVTFNAKEIYKFRIRILDPTGNVIATEGTCSLSFRTE